jgi:hypothetical protein
MIHSPFGTLSPPKAFGARGRIDNDAMRRRRFIEFEGKQYLCRKRICARWSNGVLEEWSNEKG